MLGTGTGLFGEPGPWLLAAGLGVLGSHGPESPPCAEPASQDGWSQVVDVAVSACRLSW